MMLLPAHTSLRQCGCPHGAQEASDYPPAPGRFAGAGHGVGLRNIRNRSGAPIKRVELDPSPTAPAIARNAVREEFTGRFPSEAIASAELVASELVTNAVKYGVPEVILTVHDGDGLLHVEVEDRGSPFDPSVARPEGGFGLPIVAKLAEEWGIEDTDHGLVVWAKLSPHAPGPLPKMTGTS
ncbi:MAG: hypothetical protein QOI81_1789 [Actinomycetota bacterium]|nr:hypothetical protein [Actinomycetota bacterium]